MLGEHLCFFGKRQQLVEDLLIHALAREIESAATDGQSQRLIPRVVLKRQAWCGFDT